MSKSIIYLFLLSFVVLSCEDVVEVDLKEAEKRITIDAFIETDHKPEVIISQTMAYNDQTRPELLKGAKITIFDNSTPPKSTQLHETEGKGYYTTTEDYFGEVGKVYTLNVEYKGITYSATDSLKRNSSVDTVFVKKNEDYEEFYSIFISADEPEGFGDCYRWVVYHNGKPLLHPFFMIATDDRFVDNNYVSRSQILNGVFADQAMGVSIADDDKIQVKQMSISQACLDYYLRLSTIGQQGLFSPPPANVPTNFSNGALGFFRASAVSWSDEVVAPYDISPK